MKRVAKKSPLGAPGTKSASNAGSVRVSPGRLHRALRAAVRGGHSTMRRTRKERHSNYGGSPDPRWSRYLPDHSPEGSRRGRCGTPTSNTNSRCRDWASRAWFESAANGRRGGANR